MDWNTVVTSPTEVVPAPPGGAQPEGTPHVVDNTGHAFPSSQSQDGQNTAGNVLIRNYLLPPASGCVANNPSTCSTPPALASNPYLLIRDVYSGAAYQLHSSGGAPTAAYTLLVNSSVNPMLSALVTIGADPSPGQTNWLDQTQEGLHNYFSLGTPQGCFASGASGQGSSLPNAAAWVRSPEWQGVPAPDEAYIAAQISNTQLYDMAQNGLGIRMRIQMPSYPAIPCPTCDLTGQEQLRYWSLSFVQGASSGSTDPLALDPDGVNPLTNAPGTIISLADVALAQPGGYVDLIVGVAAGFESALPSGFLSNSTGVTEGAIPVTFQTQTGYQFAALQNLSVGTTGYGYTVVDLDALPGFTPGTTSPATPAQPLELVIRNTLPNATFPSPAKWCPTAPPCTPA